jgi:hypothetical protein
MRTVVVLLSTDFNEEDLVEDDLVEDKADSSVSMSTP